MSKKITYLISNYNQEKYLADCFESLKKQTNPNWEAVIYDDASEDNSVAIIKKFLSPKIKLYQSKKNKGKTYGLKKIIAEANSEILAIFDPDDCLMPEATEEILKYYKQYPKTQWLHTKYQMMDSGLKKILKIYGKNPPSGQSFLAFGNVGLILSFRKKLYSKIEKTIQIDDRNLLYAEDKDLIYKLEEQAEAGFIPQVLYKYRYVKDSATHSQEKRNLGAKNHFLLQKEALQRRNIKGLKKKMYHFLFFLTYQYYSLKNPFFIRAGFWFLHRTLRILWKPFLRQNLK